MWEKEDIIRLIDLYEKEPCLYANTHRDYHNRPKRQETMERIAKVISIMKLNTTLRDVRDKLENLRTVYIFYRKKVLESLENGDIPIYKPTLWYYDRMHFLDEYVLKNKLMVANKLTQPVDDSNSDAVSLSYTPKDLTLEELFFHENELEEILSSIEMHYDENSQLTPGFCHDIPRNINDEYALFGKYLAQRLRRIGGEESIKLENDIVMMLMEAEKYQ